MDFKQFLNLKDNMNIDKIKNMKINKRVLAGGAAVVAACLLVTSIPWDSVGGNDNGMGTGDYELQASAGVNAAIGSEASNTTAGVNGAGADVVGEDKDVVGQPSEGQDADSAPQENTEKPQYDTFGYTNLGMASVEGNLNVRKSASKDSSIVGKLTNAAACEILGEENGWYHISSGKLKGYVSSDYIITGEEALILAQKEARLMATVTTDSLRIRKEPTTDSKKLSNIAKGEEVEVVEVLGDWVKIEFDSYDAAYVSSEFVTVEKKLKTGNTLEELRYDNGVSNVRIDLVNYALQFVGNRYVWGGNSLTKGVDCSGFTQQVYKKFGIKLPRTSYTQPKAGRKIKASKAQPGDLFFYGDRGGINHVAIYIGNGKVVHASNPRSGIKISNAYYRTPKCVVSYLD